MTINKINKTVTMYLVNAERISVSKNGNSIYKSIIDEETVHIPASDEIMENYIPYHAIAMAGFVDEKTSSEITDSVCNEVNGGGSYTGEVTITFKNESKSDTIPVALFEKFGSGSPKWNLDIAAGATETRTATAGEAIVVQSSIDNIVHSGVTVLQSGQTTSAFGLVSSVANFTFNTGEK